MAKTDKPTEQEWLKEQIRKFKKVLPDYETYAKVLQQVLVKAVKTYVPLAIVQTRPKSIASFGEKAVLKKRVGRYSDPVNRMTDLCGGRIIVPTQAEVVKVSDFIKGNFEIDNENSVDVSQRLKPTEFGYRGVHYIIQFKRGVFATEGINVKIPERAFGMKAEVQVKTILEHAWGVFTHDRAYKGAFKIPPKWEREMAALAAILEDADKSFARVEDSLKRYAASYGAYMSENQMREEIKNLKVILDADPQNTGLAARIGKLAITLGDWETAGDILSKHAGSGHPPVLRDLGVAICKIHKDKPYGKEYKEGQSYLEAAIEADPKDTDAISSLAGTYKGIDEEKVRTLYRRAFEVDTSDPYPLGNYLECEIRHFKDISIVSIFSGYINDAINRCRDQAGVGMNLPWAFYDMGYFHLLLGRPYESLAAYAKAVQLSTAPFMIETSLASLERLAVVKDKLTGFEWARRFLLVSLAAKFPEDKAGTKAKKGLKELASRDYESLTAPVTILTGGTDTGVENAINDYRQVVLEGFWNYHGTVISGGTTAGVSGLAGAIGKEYPDAIKTIGYLPRKLPHGARKDTRYDKLLRTSGSDFSPREFLQYWIDIIVSGIPLSEVKILGINGGPISAAEYRAALALGLPVAVLENSGREADKLIKDSDWADAKTSLCLPDDRMTIAAFVGGITSRLEPETREKIARAIHENYLAGKTRVSSTQDPSSAPWEQLPEYLKESNRQQADDINNKLHRIGCTVAKVTGREMVKMTFTKEEIELMAEMEHGRWNVERLLDGWKPGPKDVVKKLSPSLASWSALTEDVKEWDRDAVRNIPEFLAKVGLEVQRQT
jgi:ppGpp synthetase/RelA/SpoT-type nucleotidyltranferase